MTDIRQMMKKKPNVRYLALGALLILVWLTQWIPALATIYSQTIYPFISYVLSFFSNLFPFAIGDLFIFLSIAWLFILFMPVSAKSCLGRKFYCATANICCGFMYGSIWLGDWIILKRTFTNEPKSRIQPTLPKIFRSSLTTISPN